MRYRYLPYRWGRGRKCFFCTHWGNNFLSTNCCRTICYCLSPRDRARCQAVAIPAAEAIFNASPGRNASADDIAEFAEMCALAMSQTAPHARIKTSPSAALAIAIENPLPERRQTKEINAAANGYAAR